MEEIAKEKIIQENSIVDEVNTRDMLKARIAEQLGIKTSKKRAEERRKTLREKDINILKDMQALTAYIEGGSVEEISKEFEVDVNTFKFRMKKINEHGVRSVLDLRETNGQNQERVITRLVGQRIIELKMKEPQISSRSISKILGMQDGTKVSHVSVEDFLKKVQLDNYEPSEFAKSSFSP